MGACYHVSSVPNTILSAFEITKAVENGEIFIEPFDDANLRSASYVFTLGANYRKLKTRILDAASRPEFDEFSMSRDDGYIMSVGEFIICRTREKLRLGKNIACWLTMRGTVAQNGIDALGGEIFCEPGSEGGWDTPPRRLFNYHSAIKNGSGA
jgi:deoxycytidine triphosphate deaminase